MKKSVKIGIIAGVGGVVGLFIIYYLASLFAGNAESIKYQVTSEDGTIEVRNYPDTLTAQISFNGNRDTALEQAQAALEAFFNGGNNFLVVIPMSAPYFQQEDKRTGNQWVIWTPMPDSYNNEELPIPDNKNIKFINMPAQTYAAYSFGGGHSDGNLNENYVTLKRQLQKNKVIPESKPIYAFYKPGWTLPFARKIDVLTSVGSDLELKQE